MRSVCAHASMNYRVRIKKSRPIFAIVEISARNTVSKSKTRTYYFTIEFPKFRIEGAVDGFFFFCRAEVFRNSIETIRKLKKKNPRH